MLNTELEIRENNVKDTRLGFKMFKSSGRQLCFTLISAKRKQIWDVMAILRKFMQTQKCSRESKEKKKKAL